jgi:aryl-alcohol dehydrogenase-like predicted oxidoreductase
MDEVFGTHSVEDRLQELWTETIGLGTSVSRLAVAWTFARPEVDVAIVGMCDPAHIDNATRASDLPLDERPSPASTPSSPGR